MTLFFQTIKEHIYNEQGVVFFFRLVFVASLLSTHHYGERLAPNQNKFPDCRDMSTRELLFQWISNLKIQLSVLI
jgi:hypothetical protein